MPRRVLVERGPERLDVVEVAAPNEYALQEVMKANPQLIPSDDLGLDGELLVIGRETVLASGAIDLLCLARSGDLVLIEFKTGPQNPDFRRVLAQLIDYGSDLWGMSIDDFDRGVVQRYLGSAHRDEAFLGATDLGDAIGMTNWDLESEEVDALRSRLIDVLELGDFVYVVAAQRFTNGMTTSLDYLNATMRHGRFYLVEIVRLEGADLVAHASQVVAAPQRISRGGEARPASQANEADFLAALPTGVLREAMQDIFATCATLGLIVSWGSKGASIRLRTPDRAEPLSIGWAFLPDDQWYSARDLTLGVDEASLAQTPSVESAVRAFIDQIGDIAGAKPVGRSLRAFTFKPDVVPQAKDAIVRALDDVVEAVQGIA